MKQLFCPCVLVNILFLKTTTFLLFVTMKTKFAFCILSYLFTVLYRLNKEWAIRRSKILFSIFFLGDRFVVVVVVVVVGFCFCFCFCFWFCLFFCSFCSALMVCVWCLFVHKNNIIIHRSDYAHNTFLNDVLRWYPFRWCFYIQNTALGIVVFFKIVIAICMCFSTQQLLNLITIDSTIHRSYLICA